jgi:predicted phage terminase large subunit-like protein
MTTLQPIPSGIPQCPAVMSRLHIEAEQCRQKFQVFVEKAWHVLEPQTLFVAGIHVEAICEHLQAVNEGRIKNLIINVPPGHAKSLLTAVLWPAWVWTSHPEARWLFSGYREDLALRDSVKCRRLVTSDWYQKRWGWLYRLRDDQNEKHRFENTASGYRVVVPLGTGTGERGDYVVVDDPHSVDQAESDVKRTKAIDWWNGSMATRLNDLNTGHKVVIQQRLHEADLSGDLLVKGGYELLCLPAEFESDRRCVTSIGWADPRQEAGALLWPKRITQSNLDELKRTLGSYRYAGQYQQRPAPAEGGIFKRFWLRYWRPAHLELPPVQLKTPDGQLISIEAIPIPAQFDQIIQSWDMSFKGLDTSDFVVGQVWGAVKADRYLLDQIRKRLNMPGTKEAVRELSRKWPKAGVKLVEDKANGPAVIQELQHDLSGLVAVTPEGGKLVRAQAVSSQIESGNVYLPHPAIAPWIDGWIEEAAAFPNGRNDDQVDAMTQALTRLRTSAASYLIPESRITINPFSIPANWPRAFAMVVARDRVAALWAAQDPGGTIYLYGEHSLPHAEPSQNARAILTHGDWIPGLIHVVNESTETHRVTSLYRKLELEVQSCTAVDDAALYDFSQFSVNNRLKVFTSLLTFMEEYRIGDVQSPMLLCAQALLTHRNIMRTQPEPEEEELGYGNGPCYGSGAWMR